MGVFVRPDSKFFWIYIPSDSGKGIRERTNVPADPAHRALAERIYKHRMAEVAHAEKFRPRTLQAPRSDLGGWCYIYFVSDGTKIKIGRAVNVLNRVRAMQTGHPKPLRVLATFMAHHSIERLLHRHFAELQITKGKEWFRSTPELLAFVERVAAGVNPVAELINHSRDVHGRFA